MAVSIFIHTLNKKLFPLLFCLPFLVHGDLFELSHDDITYCVDPDWAPYESIVDGKHIGISHHYLLLISKYSDLNFTLYPTQTWQESLEAIAQGKCQLMPMLNVSPARQTTMSFSHSYFTSANVLYAHIQDPLLAGFSSLTTESIAVVEDYRLHHFLKDNFAFITIVPVENESAGLALLNDNKVDLFVGSFYSSNQIIHDRAYRHLRIVGITELDDQLKVGVAKSHEHLIPLINQAIKTFTTADHRSVFAQLRSEVVISKTDHTLALQVAFIALMIFLILFAFHIASLQQRKHLALKNNALHQLRKELEQKNSQLAELTVKDHLTGLYNRLHLNEHIDTNIKLKDRYNTACCIILIDIDDFKQFNDTYGHKVGDDVLKKVASVLLGISRGTDICARWGGEEFAILCPETTLEEAIFLAERFQERLAQCGVHNLSQQAKDNNDNSNDNDFAHQAQQTMPNITCSIGISELAKNSNETSWFMDADKAMYAAKAQGKNCIYINSLE